MEINNTSNNCHFNHGIMPNTRCRREKILNSNYCYWHDPNIDKTDKKHPFLEGKSIKEALEKESKINKKFMGFQLEKADLSYLVLEGIDLSWSNVKRANLFASSFHNVKFSYTEFYGANLTGANFKGTDKKLLYMADLQKCNLENAKIQGFYLESVKLNAASLKGTIFKDMEFQNVEWGDFSELNINVSNAAYFKNYYRDKGLFDLSDQFYIKQIQCFLGQKSISSYKKFLYKLWWYSSKFGTSFLNWIIVSLGISTIFGMIFSIFPSLFNEFNTPFSPFYFSIVTFTTLGFGDIKPITLGGEILVAIEVFIGYIMLGGLITIFASKFIRR